MTTRFTRFLLGGAGFLLAVAVAAPARPDHAVATQTKVAQSGTVQVASVSPSFCKNWI